MEETTNSLPTIKTGDELAEEEQQARLAEVRQYLLDARVNYPEPYYMLEYNGVPFSTIGGIQALSGQKKNGKTFVLAQLMAAILADNGPRAQEYLPGLRVPERTVDHLDHIRRPELTDEEREKNPYKPTVLYVDTEMEKLNSAKVLRRVHWLCDWPTDEPNDRFHVLWLRGVTDVKDDEGKTAERAYRKRYRLIQMAIEMLQPDAVFIDGIRDIIGDFNDNAESAALVGELMALAEQQHICIWNVLHMNPRPGNDDESKMRGHLGTELGNKITDTLVSIKKKDDNGVNFTVKQQDARGKDMEDWKFCVTDAAGALGVPRIYQSAPVTTNAPANDSVEDIKAWLKEAEDRYNWPMSRNEVKKKVFGEIGGQNNNDRRQADLVVALNLKLLEESSVKQNGHYLLQIGEDMPF
jgi:hypothetical protein